MSDELFGSPCQPVSRVDPTPGRGPVLLGGIGLLGLVLTLGSPGLLPAGELDPIRLCQLRHLNPPLHWDNVEAEPQWVCGAKPCRDDTHQMHVVSLLPGRSVTFKAPPGASVRVFRPCGPLSADDVELWISNGSGLYCRYATALSADGKSVLAAPIRRQTSLVRVTRPANHTCGIHVALFTSRQDSIEPLAAYRCLIEDCGPLVKLRRGDQPNARSHLCLVPGKPRALCVTGPAHLAVETRLHYPAAEARAFQAYRVYVRLDGELHRLLDYETSPERKHRIQVDGQEQVVGRRATGYVEIPPGDHRLELDVTATLYARVLTSTEPDYLLPRLNRPCYQAMCARGGHEPSGDLISIWDLQPEEVEWLALAGTRFVGFQEWIARRSARDNGYREGGLRGTMLMRIVAAQRPEDPQVLAAAEKLLQFHTFYRNLLPVEKQHSQEQVFAWCRQRRLRDSGETPYDPVVAEQHIDDAIDHLRGAFFVGPGGNMQTANRYRLPAEVGPTLLRVIVDRGRLRRSSQLWVQYDDRTPFQLEAVCHDPLMPGDYAPSAAEAGLSALRWQHRQADGGTLGGPFSRNRVPAALIPAATAELLLSAGVREVRVWSLAADAKQLRVALQYRAAKPYRLSESEYLQMQRRAGDGLAPVDLLADETPAEGAPYCVRELQNHWLPLVRLLRAHQRTFTAGIVARKIDLQAGEPLNSEEVEALAAKAARLAEQRHWLPMLETCSRLLPHASGPLRRTALLGRVTALQHLGENYLAERLLRSTLLFDPDARARQDAFDQLERSYTRTGDVEALERLLSVAVLREPTAEHLGDLAEVLLENGRHDFALMAALAAGQEQSPTEVILRAAYQLRWWDVFRRAAGQITDARQGHYWQAYDCLYSGKYYQAASHFRAAGQTGEQLAKHVEQGLNIHRRLKAPSLQTRAEAVFEWERWSSEHPGPYVWREDGSLVTDYSGAESVYSVNRDTYTQFYRAKPSRPVKLTVLGPTRLKIEVRPVHSGSAAAPVDDWLHVCLEGRHHLVAVNGNRPSTGLEIAGNDTDLPGTKVETELELGPGLHHLEVSGGTLELLVRVHARRPERPLSVLPPLGRDTLQAVLAGEYTAMRTHAASVATRVRLRVLPARPCPQAVVCPLLEQASPQSADHGDHWQRLGELTAARLALRTGEPFHGRTDALRTWALGAEDAAPDERVLALARLASLGTREETASQTPRGTVPFSLRENRDSPQRENRDSPQRENRDSPQSLRSLPPRLLEAVLLARGQIEAAMTLPQDDTDDAIVRRMTLLLYRAETDARQTHRCLVLGKQLFADHPQVAGLADLHRRLARKSSWTAFQGVHRSAGIRTIEVSGWQPEAPALRVRKSLLQRPLAEESVLSGHRSLVVGLENERATILKLSLSLAVLESLAPAPITLVYQRDEQPVERVVLAEDDSQRTVQIAVPAGSHHVRIRIERPTSNQYVRVRIAELAGNDSGDDAGDDAGQAAAEGVPLLREADRYYQVATHDEPVRLTVEGPSWLRIDRLDDGVTVSRYVAVEQRTRQIELKPDADQQEGLFRLFACAAEPKKKITHPQWVKVEPQPVPPPLLATLPVLGPADEESPDGYWLVSPGAGGDRDLAALATASPDAPLLQLDVEDTYRLGGQEDGTWSFGVGAFQRRALEEGFGGREPDEFLQLLATHRYFDPSRRNYWKTDVLLRPRDQSGPTLGLQERLRHDPDWLPVTFHLDAAAWLQRPGDALPPDSGDTEWSVRLRGRVTQRRQLTPKAYHVPSLSIFGRLMSLDQIAYRAGRVDQDIFTTYKSDHRLGLILSDTLACRPWLDTKWWVRPSLLSNEDFGVDHLSLRTGWTQAVGSLDVDAAYRVAWFMADEHRRIPLTQHLLYVDVLLHGWWYARRRSEIGFGLIHDLARGSTSANLTWTCYFDNGRDYRDYLPGELGFPALRRQRALEHLSQSSLYWQ